MNIKNLFPKVAIALVLARIYSYKLVSENNKSVNVSKNVKF